ncbi:hypothetical protein [Paenibacillus sp.]|uniref:hypothetical protein n=1 Tax=Paenibacillus sp. TaxID=58172 RepID=UPI002D354516|nr:hypothetical protein [Paenibacillus sp.]HZG84857.1 hypothetical protein [Paenibacillus sp.]
MNCQKSIVDLLKKLPPNYTLGTVYLNGAPVVVQKFMNLNDELAYFVDEEGQVVIMDSGKIDGLSFGAAEEEEEEEEEAGQ